MPRLISARRLTGGDVWRQPSLEEPKETWSRALSGSAKQKQRVVGGS